MSEQKKKTDALPKPPGSHRNSECGKFPMRRLCPQGLILHLADDLLPALCRFLKLLPLIPFPLRDLYGDGIVAGMLHHRHPVGFTKPLTTSA